MTLVSKISSLVCLFAVACAAAPPPAPVSAPAPEPEAPKPPPSTPEITVKAASEPAPPEPEAVTLPTTCSAPGSGVCTPPAAFVSELCKRRSTDLALAMFKKTSPWQRAYLRLDMDAWYTAARLSSPVRLELDEEVIVIANRGGNAGGVQVGGGSFDVVRWDGTCASVMADEVTFKKPRAPRASPVAWEKIGEEFRDALLQKPAIRARRDAYRKRCTEDRGAPACQDARTQLSDIITEHVRRGGEMPDPELALR